MRNCIFEIASNEALKNDVYRLTMQGDCLNEIIPGQFVNIKIDGTFLRRPLSVCDIEGDMLTVVYKVKGTGTEFLSRMQRGRLDVLTELGNGFDMSKAGAAPLLIGGGLGFTPLYFLAKRLTEGGTVPEVILGFNTAEEVLYEDEFLELGANTIITTADGSRGTKGFASDAMIGLEYTYFYSCGPESMFKAINKNAAAEGEFSFEARMGCGFGACMGCSCKTITGSKRICKDGPVIKRSEVLWET